MQDYLHKEDLEGVLDKCRNLPNYPTVYYIDMLSGPVCSVDLFRGINTNMDYIEPVEILTCKEISFVRVYNDYWNDCF
jgi:hypothetical protein